MYCKNCGALLNADSNFCPNCGNVIVKSKNSYTNFFISILLMLFIVVISFLILNSFFANTTYGNTIEYENLTFSVPIKYKAEINSDDNYLYIYNDDYYYSFRLSDGNLSTFTAQEGRVLQKYLAENEIRNSNYEVKNYNNQSVVTIECYESDGSYILAIMEAPIKNKIIVSKIYTKDLTIDRSQLDTLKIILEGIKDE